MGKGESLVGCGEDGHEIEIEIEIERLGCEGEGGRQAVQQTERNAIMTVAEWTS